MQRGTRVDDPALPVVLSESRINEKARELAKIMGEVEQLEARKAAANKKAQKEIDERESVAHRIAAEIRNQEEFRDQSTLTFEEDQAKRAEPTLGEASAALAEIARRVEAFVLPEKCSKCEGPVAAVTDTRAVLPSGDDNPALDKVAGWICSNEECLESFMVVDQVAEEATGEPATEPDERAKCAGCDTVLSAIEIVKKLGLCETCQVQPHEPVDVSDATTTTEPEASTVDDAIDDDPRPRCKTEACRAVLTPDECEAGLGICSRCVDATIVGDAAVQG